MNVLELNTTIKLRRDNDYNYNKVENTFIPKRGEVCLVDTARNGLRTKCGDGITPWGQLDYIDEYIVQGYYSNGNFYRDSQYTIQVQGANNKVYIDIKEHALYFYHEGNFISISNEKYELATETQMGIMKLYQTIGQNTDGTMSQKAIADELDDKFEVTLNIGEEMLIFTQD